MSLHIIVVTLGSGNTAISTPTAGSPSIRCRQLRLESETGNADVKFGDATLTSTNYGGIVTAGPTNAVTFLQDTHSLDLSSIYLLGTQNQKVHVTYVQ